jgi:hypothetical protein
MTDRRPGWILAMSLICSTALIAGLGIFAWMDRQPDSELVGALRTASERSGNSFEADLSDYFPGNWDRVVIVCKGAIVSEVDEAIGSPWDEATQVESEAFLSSLVLVRGNSVESSISTGPDSGWAYVPCPVKLDPAERAFSRQVAVVPVLRLFCDSRTTATWIRISGTSTTQSSIV